VDTPRSPSLFAGPRRPWAEAQAGPARLLSPPRALGPKTSTDRIDSLGQPVSDKKNGFSFFFYYLKMEMVWKMFDYSILLQIC
jgi:hypothetical protein